MIFDCFYKKVYDSAVLHRLFFLRPQNARKEMHPESIKDLGPVNAGVCPKDPGYLLSLCQRREWHSPRRVTFAKGAKEAPPHDL